MPGNAPEAFQEINRLRGRLRKLLDDTFPAPGPATAVPGQWTPPADILVDERQVAVTLEVCGVAKEDLEVVLHGSVLTVSGRRRRDGEERLLLAERPAGGFSRSFSLAEEPKSYSAALKDGVLTIALERRETP